MKTDPITGDKTLMEKTVNGKEISVQRTFFRGFSFDCFVDGYICASFTTLEQSQDWFNQADELFGPKSQLSYRELMGL